MVLIDMIRATYFVLFLFSGFMATKLKKSDLSTEERARTAMLNKTDADAFIEGTRIRPLQYATIQGHYDVAELLILAKVNVSHVGEMDRTALHYAAIYRRHKIAKLLVRHGANPNAKDFKGFTPLMYSVRAEDSNMVQFLTEEAQADVNSQNHNGLTALLLAAQRCTMTVQYLVSRGANLNDAFKGKTALHFAVFDMRPDMTNLLLDAGAPTEIVDQANCTPLDYLAREDDDRNLKARRETITAMIKAGAAIRRMEFLTEYSPMLKEFCNWEPVNGETFEIFWFKVARILFRNNGGGDLKEKIRYYMKGDLFIAYRILRLCAPNRIARASTVVEFDHKVMSTHQHFIEALKTKMLQKRHCLSEGPTDTSRDADHDNANAAAENGIRTLKDCKKITRMALALSLVAVEHPQLGDDISKIINEDDEYLEWEFPNLSKNDIIGIIKSKSGRWSKPNVMERLKKFKFSRSIKLSNE